MLRTFIFKYGGKELALPITPESFTAETAVKPETVNVHDVGDADILGKPSLQAIKLECLFPANDYPFASIEMEPYEYVRMFQKWAKSGKVLRFMVSDTPVNISVRVESISYSERDGTNDVYATISLREHRTLEATATEGTAPAGGTRAAPDGSAVAGAFAYTAKYGDTLAAICRKNYGDGSAKFYNALARYNGKPNPNILMTGEVLKIPPRESLGV